MFSKVQTRTVQQPSPSVNGWSVIDQDIWEFNAQGKLFTLAIVVG